MGFEDRDYYRDESEGGFFSTAGVGAACKALIAINIAIFLLQVLSTKGGGSLATQWLEFDAERILQGEIWRYVTWGFGYGGDPLAFIFEMLFIWWFGKSLETMYGTRELILLYAASILTGATAALLGFFASGLNVAFMGAEAAVMAITVVFAWHYPKHQILLFFLIPVPIWVIVAIYVVYGLVSSGNIGFGGPFAAGLAAVGFGLLYGWQDWRIGNLIPSGAPRLRMPRRKPKLRVFEPEQQQSLDRQVDDILAKIHEHGEASLTDRERKTLQEASRRYKRT